MNAHRLVPAAVLAALLLSACGGRAPEPPAPVDGRQAALAAETASRPEGPRRLIFRWDLQEPSLRVRGEGVVRMEPPYRARLDLFNTSGEGVARAALVDDEVRLPPEALDVPLPPAPLFWATVGIFRPGMGTALLGATEDPQGTLVRYGYADGRRLHFLLDGRRVIRASLLVDGRVEEEVRVDWEAGDGGSSPRSVRYRQMRETRELNLILESESHVEAFPPDIWRFGG